MIDWDPDRVDLHGIWILILSQHDICSMINCFDEDYDFFYTKVYELIKQGEISLSS
jgi:hypothetical protein